MLEQNDKSEVIKDFLGEIVYDSFKAEILQKIVNTSIKYKTNPELAVDKIIETAKQAGYILDKKEFIEIIVDFLQREKELTELLEFGTSYMEPGANILGTVDGRVAESL